MVSPPEIQSKFKRTGHEKKICLKYSGGGNKLSNRGQRTCDHSRMRFAVFWNPQVLLQYCTILLKMAARSQINDSIGKDLSFIIIRIIEYMLFNMFSGEYRIF